MEGGITRITFGESGAWVTRPVNSAGVHETQNARQRATRGPWETSLNCSAGVHETQNARQGLRDPKFPVFEQMKRNWEQNGEFESGI